MCKDGLNLSRSSFAVDVVIDVDEDALEKLDVY